MIAIAAATISTPSNTAEKYSAFAWPKLCSASAGLATTRNATKAATAATRLTNDSSASDSRPTEPLTRQAISFITITTIAVAILSNA